MKEFVNIKGFPGYTISRSGVVIGVKGAPLTHFLNVDGYPVVYMRFNKKNFCRRVHRLLAETFLPNPHNLPVVNHIDGNKENFSLDNLEWVTVKENDRHARDVLKVVCGNRVVNEPIVVDICQMMQAGFSNQQIMEAMDISISIISKIRTGKSWVNISKDFNLRPRVGRLLISQVKEICERLNSGESVEYIAESMNDRYVTKDAIRKISGFITYKQITKDILLPREKRSSTIPRGSRVK